GAMPYNWGSFMPAARGMLQLMKGMEETVIRAAVEGNYGAALHAFTINPLVPAGNTAKRVLDELLYAHKEHLPQFAEKIKEIEAKQPEVVEYVDELMESN
ncbi:MAG TPA: 6-phospho-beta-glucosidase, partial [Facklamia tabacinasalis]|nr:6-phospho-beta-glucosidase [Ruoffia tabacinasalis]